MSHGEELEHLRFAFLCFVFVKLIGHYELRPEVQSMFEILNSDIVIFQETKIQRKDLRDDMVHVPGWDCFFSLPRVKKGKRGSQMLIEYIITLEKGIREL